MFIPIPSFRLFDFQSVNMADTFESALHGCHQVAHCMRQVLPMYVYMLFLVGVCKAIQL